MHIHIQYTTTYYSSGNCSGKSTSQSMSLTQPTCAAVSAYYYSQLSYSKSVCNK